MNTDLENELKRGFNLRPELREFTGLLQSLWGGGGTRRAIRYGGRRDQLQTLDRYGWVQLSTVQSPIDPVVLTSAGIQAAERIASRRANHRERRRASRDAVLYWLDEPENEHVTGVDLAAMAEYGFFLGVPFTEDEIGKATTWLVSEGYLEAITAWGGAVIRPRLTSKGTNVTDREGSTSDAEAPPSAGVQIGSQVNNFGAGATQNIAGRDVHTHSEAALSAAEKNTLDGIISLLDLARERLADTSPDGATQVEQVRAELTTQASLETADHGKIRALLTQVKGFAQTFGATVGMLTYAASESDALLTALTS